jgi:hypothetical protein
MKIECREIGQSTEVMHKLCQQKCGKRLPLLLPLLAKKQKARPVTNRIGLDPAQGRILVRCVDGGEK